MQTAVIAARGQKAEPRFPLTGEKMCQTGNILRVMPDIGFALNHTPDRDTCKYSIELVMADKSSEQMRIICPDVSVTNNLDGTFTVLDGRQEGGTRNLYSVRGQCFNVCCDELTVKLFNESAVASVQFNLELVPGRATWQYQPQPILLRESTVPGASFNAAAIPPRNSHFFSFDFEDNTGNPQIQQFAIDNSLLRTIPSTAVSAANVSGRLYQRVYDLHPLCVYLVITGSAVVSYGIKWHMFF